MENTLKYFLGKVVIISGEKIKYDKYLCLANYFGQR